MNNTFGMIDVIYITNLPSFYKINLLNKIAKKRNILVIFIEESSVQRNEDFFKGNKEFQYISIAKKSILGKVLFIFKVLKSTMFEHLIIGGWDDIVLWIAAFVSPKFKNGVVVESSIYESKTTGIKGFIKKIFCTRVSKAYVSGKSQQILVEKLNFKGEIIITKGVGIFNIRDQVPYIKASAVSKYLYVGRLSHEKNLISLIEAFNQLPELVLNIVGFGPQEKYLKSISKQNVFFHGAIPNSELYKYYLKNDVFILPSSSEPWGMVVEEALNCGLPVIVSDKVGCADEIVNGNNGIIFKLSDSDGIINAVKKMQSIDYYNTLRLNISQMDFNSASEHQVNCFLK